MERHTVDGSRVLGACVSRCGESGACNSASGVKLAPLEVDRYDPAPYADSSSVNLDLSGVAYRTRHEAGGGSVWISSVEGRVVTEHFDVTVEYSHLDNVVVKQATGHFAVPWNADGPLWSPPRRDGLGTSAAVATPKEGGQ